MATKVWIKIDPTDKILMKRYVNRQGKGQQYFTKQLAKNMNDFVPFDTGNLKDISCSVETSRIIYNAPYAKKAYYTNKGMGKQGMKRGGLRGLRWYRRCWTQRKDTILQSLAKYCRVKIK